MTIKLLSYADFADLCVNKQAAYQAITLIVENEDGKAQSGLPFGEWQGAQFPEATGLVQYIPVPWLTEHTKQFYVEKPIPQAIKNYRDCPINKNYDIIENLTRLSFTETELVMDQEDYINLFHELGPSAFDTGSRSKMCIFKGPVNDICIVWSGK